jgi:hypothetical protein
MTRRVGLVSHTPDTLALVVGTRATGRIDTIGRIRSRSLVIKDLVVQSDGNTVHHLLNSVFDADEQAVMFADGWIGIARRDPYRVEWRAQDGQWLRGPAIPVPVVRVDEPEKCLTARALSVEQPPDAGEELRLRERLLEIVRR